ncbi:sialidase family protein [Adhaeretor mobilis]|uniref:exo-alpha-sialidase n=1 Tax=Adhaeretor mobilis TaxID=1930276 RepID=A0A517MW19_9BACT|nr:sialidase family protein [Adhaeretor mobilis]QDS99083.1 Sialidase precursor [Adhaeretor mobilis]
MLTRITFSILLVLIVSISIRSALAATSPEERFDRDALESRFSSDVFGYTHRDGFQSRYGYRIPVALATNNDTVLAFIERRNGLGDHAHNDIVLRRSEDGGRSWGDVIVIADEGDRCLCNPCAVLIPESGRVLMMYQDYAPDRHSVDIPHQRVKKVEPGFEGDDIVRTYLSHSDDDGKTWSVPRDVTSGTKRENIGAIGSGPGIGIVLSTGKHQGRIVMPYNESWYDENDLRHYNVYAAFSDDGGETWQVGEPAPFDKRYKGSGGEVQMVELSDGSIMLNSRSSLGNFYRKTSVSVDGGVTWSPVIDEEQLPEPVCMGSILRAKLPGEEDKHCLLFSCPASKEARKQGTLYASYDDGKTWSESWVLEPNEFAYSSLVQFSDGSIGCFYESKDYRRMIFTRFPIEHFFRNAVESE